MVDPKIDSGQYLLKEAEFLRTSYSDYAKEIGALERYALLSTGAIWSWVATNPASTFAPLLAWIPLILQTLFGLRAWGVYRDMVFVGDYLKRIEHSLGLAAGLGWGHLLAQRSGRIRVLTGYGFWLALSVVSMLIAVFYGPRS